MKEKGRKQFSPHIECITYERKINKIKVAAQSTFILHFIRMENTARRERHFVKKENVCKKIQ